MNLYILQHENGTVTYGNWPITERGIEALKFEVSEKDLKAVQDGEKDFSVENGKLKIVTSTRKADREAQEAQIKLAIAQRREEKNILKAKLEKGEATLAEVQQALSKIL